TTFFFQAEDGIRDFHVTGVQTCALPIWILEAVGDDKLVYNPVSKIPLIDERKRTRKTSYLESYQDQEKYTDAAYLEDPSYGMLRSEERRVGKECSYRWLPALADIKRIEE